MRDRSREIAVELGAWRLIAQQVGAIDEVRSCRKTTPQDVLRLVESLRKMLVQWQRGYDKLRKELKESAELNRDFVGVIRAMCASFSSALKEYEAGVQQVGTLVDKWIGMADATLPDVD